MHTTLRPLAGVFAGLALLGCVAAAAAQTPKAPDVADFERALDHRLQQLIPDGTTERNVRFLTVLVGKPDGTSYPFRATFIIRDYGAGFPRNHYYGETCVSPMNEVDYTMEKDAFGGWNVQGRMTPNLSQKVCTANPAEGASSRPAAGLPGTPAPAAGTAASTGLPPQTAGAARPAAATTTSGAGTTAVATGAYLCWANGEARGFMNFRVTGPGTYMGGDNKPGTLALDPSNSHITFKGGSMDGATPDGFFTLYHVVQGRPTFSIQSPRGSEAIFCQHQ